jgi:hypothetical protein
MSPKERNGERRSDKAYFNGWTDKLHPGEGGRTPLATRTRREKLNLLGPYSHNDGSQRLKRFFVPHGTEVGLVSDVVLQLGVKGESPGKMENASALLA